MVLGRAGKDGREMTQGFLLTTAGFFLMAAALIGMTVTTFTGKWQRRRLEEKLTKRYGGGDYFSKNREENG